MFDISAHMAVDVRSLMAKITTYSTISFIAARSRERHRLAICISLSPHLISSLDADMMWCREGSLCRYILWQTAKYRHRRRLKQ